jgi:UDP-N-acetylmuramate dehydrogenase
MTTYRVGGPAAVLASPRTLAELMLVGEVVARLDLPVAVIGRGSNLLVADDGFCGVVVTISEIAGESDRISVGEAAGGLAEVRAGGAVALPVLARRTVAAGLVGFEWAVGVPGSVGGAVRMNAGGHGSDTAASLRTASIVDLRRGIAAEVPADRLGLRFRGSDLADHQVVVAATLRLEHDPSAARDAGERTLAEIVHWRREHQPGGQNAGSVFVNPRPGELAAAQLIDACGLRGRRVGGAQVSDKHANFIQASESATAADVRSLMELVRAAVLDHSGHLLRSEIRLLGFDDASDEQPTGVVL